jgi:hypothetical protein
MTTFLLSHYRLPHSKTKHTVVVVCRTSVRKVVLMSQYTLG